MKEVEAFLIANGFKIMEPNSYANDLCNVVIADEGYELAFNNGDAVYSKDHNIFWLIGALTYYGFIPKNYVG